MSNAGISNLEFTTSGSGFHRFIGLSLSGGKNDKACIAVIEYFPKYHKIFLTKIYDKITGEPSYSADQRINDILSSYKDSIESIAVDAPFQLPLCLDCKLVCPGYEDCGEEHVAWMRKQIQKKQKKKKVKKAFTPYTQKSVEFIVNDDLEENFQLSHSLGANLAPLVARCVFLKRRFSEAKWIEVFPKLSIWRIGRSMNVSKSDLRFHRHAVSGNEVRETILEELVEHKLAFVYDQDKKIMVQNNHAFEAFICALTGFLKYFDQTEERPKDFPAKESWIDFPSEKIKWDKV